MFRKSKIIIAISGILIGFASVLVVYFSLMTAGVIGGDASSNSLVFTTGSMEKTYDGEALIFEQYSLKEGSLKEGHKFDVSFTGFQTEVGESYNDIVVTIKDQSGYDVTSRYKITYDLGTLTVHAREITLESFSAQKQYDGVELKCHEYKVSAGSLISGHTIETNFTGSLTERGKQENTFGILIFIIICVTIIGLNFNSYQYCTKDEIVVKKFYKIKENRYDYEDIEKVVKELYNSDNGRIPYHYVAYFKNGDKLTLAVSKNIEVKNIEKILEDRIIYVEIDDSRIY